MDIPDGNAYYWDARSVEPVFSRAESEVGQRNDLCMHLCRDVSEIAFVDTQMDASTHKHILLSYSFQVMHKYNPKGASFQEANSCCNTARQTTEVFVHDGVQTIDLPAHSPDSDP